jgi:sigma-B regulation protein RsbU (phosphoserine phosphatase)
VAQNRDQDQDQDQDDGVTTLETFQSLYDDAPCGLLVTRTNGTIVRVNRSFCACLGRTPEELVVKLRLQDLLTVGGRIFHQTHWQPLLAMQGSIAEVKFELLHRDGRKVPMMLNVVRRLRSPERSETGEAQAGAVEVDEISAVVAEYERELVAQRQRADALARKEKALRTALHATQERLNQALQAGALYVWDFDVGSNEFHFDDAVSVLLGFASARPVDIADLRGVMH